MCSFILFKVFGVTYLVSESVTQESESKCARNASYTFLILLENLE